MTGEKANPTRAKNAQVQSAPAEMPGVEEIKELLLRFHADTASAWRHERDGIAAFAASAILALFAPILAEKEREIERLQDIRDRRGCKIIELSARALAAEAALAGLRQSILDAEIQSDDDEKAQARLDRLAAAIRAQGE